MIECSCGRIIISPDHLRGQRVQRSFTKDGVEMMLAVRVLDGTTCPACLAADGWSKAK